MLQVRVLPRQLDVNAADALYGGSGENRRRVRNRRRMASEKGGVGSATRLRGDMTAVPDRPTLAERFADDPAALQECYTALGPMVLAFIRRLVGPADAEDVLQQVFLDAWRTRERFDPAHRLEPWLLDVARKRSIDHLRREGRRRVAVEAAIAAAESVDVVQFAARYVDAVTVRQALDRLSEVERESVVLAYFGDLSYPEVASRLGVPVGTVKARVFRGLRSLSAALSEEVTR